MVRRLLSRHSGHERREGCCDHPAAHGTRISPPGRRAGTGDYRWGVAHDLLDIARRIAIEAGELAARRRREGVSVAATKSTEVDIVTEADRETERFIRAALADARPGDGILGEEEGGGVSGSSGLHWIVDPIDGTVNFLYGLPDWAVSIAVEVRGRIVAGVVNAAARGEVYTASEGGGAWLAGERLRCNPAAPLGQALVATGFGYDAALRAEQAEVLTGVLPRVRDIRRGGSCAVDLCSVASGRVDAYYERGVNYWDYAAGGLIAAEAGATLGVLDVEPGGERVTLCAAPGLFEELHGLLTPLHTESGS